MAEIATGRTSATSGASNEDRHIRYVDDRIHLFAPAFAPILLLKGGLMPGPNGERIKVKGIIESGFVPAKEIDWYDKELLATDIFINNAAGYAAGATVLNVDDGTGTTSKVPRANDIYRVVTTGSTAYEEQIYVKSFDPTAGATGEITVIRGIGSTTAAALVDDDELQLLGNANPEGSTSRGFRQVLASKNNNAMEITRDDWSITRSADRIRTYGGRDKAETMAEAAVNHVRQLERKLTWGVKDTTLTDTNGNAVQSAGGLFDFVPNIFASAAADSAGLFTGLSHGGTISDIELDETFGEQAFKFGNTRRKKLMIGSAVFAKIWNRISRTSSTIRTFIKQTAFGVQITEFITAFGSWDYLPSGALDEVDNSNAFLLDPENIKFCYLDNTFMVDNTQTPGQDGYEGYFMTEWTLQVQGLKTHSRFRDVTGPA